MFGEGRGRGERVKGGRVSSYLASDSAVAAVVGSHLGAGPEVDEFLLRVAVVDVLLSGHAAHGVVDKAVDAVVADLVSGAETVGVVCKRPVDDASLRAGSVTPEAGDGVQDNRLGEFTSITGLIPVRLGALVPALVADELLVGVHVQSVVGEECALEYRQSV